MNSKFLIPGENIQPEFCNKVYLSGVQVLIQIPLMQRELDKKNNLDTAGLITGYRGSPLGGYDQLLWKNEKQLKLNNIVFQPGLNEDLAATALWGTQMHKAFGAVKYDGVFGIWYGKGPGVDRTGDVFRSANMMGTSKTGGVLVISGDDHAAQSSTFPHQTDGIFEAVHIPVLQPANVKEVFEFGLAGIALSRYSGLWVALKTIADVVEAAGTVELKAPKPYLVPVDQGYDQYLNWDISLKWPKQRFEMEKRLIEYRLPAVKRWVKLNNIDKIIFNAHNRTLGIITVGKAHQDLMQALENLSISDTKMEALGISIYKVGMSWPLVEDGIMDFAIGHQQILVIEEKKAVVEAQVKDILYNLTADKRPIVVGKKDQTGNMMLPEILEYSPSIVAEVLVKLLNHDQDLCQAFEKQRAAVKQIIDNKAVRAPTFCSGCPHNTSTTVPDGSISGGGIGCHIMALMMPDRKTDTFSQMGGEGIQWVGAQPFSETKHIFQNLGDGTYEHSGILAIRAAVAAGTNITFKILYNDAVAMTGGQPTEGNNNPARISRQLRAEGVEEIYLVSDNVEKWAKAKDLAAHVKIAHRDELDRVQITLREVSGTSAIIYEQTCAAEKRRRGKRIQAPALPTRAFIHNRICEGCGDCSKQSNCISIEPLNTAFGIKRKINQSSCNTDLSCLKGFCPSFVEVEGAVRAKSTAFSSQVEQQLIGALIEVQPPRITGSYNILFAGIGGTGVLTVGALVGNAALLDQKNSNVLDFTGLAQKNGAVFSQVKITDNNSEIHSSRIGLGQTELLLGADMLYAASTEILSKVSVEKTSAVINSDLTPTSNFIINRDEKIDKDELRSKIQSNTKKANYFEFNANLVCVSLFGEPTFVHILMLGYAWQKQLIPISLISLVEVIENGVAPKDNLRAFQWGRILAQHPETIQSFTNNDIVLQDELATDTLIEKYRTELIDYQNVAYSERYFQVIEKVTQKSANLNINDKIIRTVVINLYKVMAYKDEYEVARLYSSVDFKKGLDRQFDKVDKMYIWLAPPFLNIFKKDKQVQKKIKFGSWVFKLFSVLSAFKWMRGKSLDPFKYNPERKLEVNLREDYIDLVDQVLSHLNQDNVLEAEHILSLVADVRGFGELKTHSIQTYYEKIKPMLEHYKANVKLIKIYTEA
ncbi:indolepyruvate ferredoxin oxidoreductase family protein [Acinetobacter pullicarnis]|uniref:indolepyruvate ferredoxin oxidoreductase family protein n=1 Tax=Acinetobacter pullicarnis TaxID=2576829 RepID=UPI0011229427|nr:indolepyruvate ferredoxin oxidoreductase family protein [Acinetobacter pullicarnis]